MPIKVLEVKTSRKGSSPICRITRRLTTASFLLLYFFSFLFLVLLPNSKISYYYFFGKPWSKIDWRWVRQYLWGLDDGTSHSTGLCQCNQSQSVSFTKYQYSVRLHLFIFSFSFNSLQIQKILNLQSIEFQFSFYCSQPLSNHPFINFFCEITFNIFQQI